MRTTNPGYSTPDNHDTAFVSETESSLNQAMGFQSTELRRDTKTAEIVEKAIKLQENLSTMAAATYLKANGVDFEVTFRVLNRPAQRRKNPE